LHQEHLHRCDPPASDRNSDGEDYYRLVSAFYSSFNGAGVSPPDDSLINGWLPPASGIDILYTATHIAVRGETASEWNPVNDTRDQNENQTNDGDEVSVSLPDDAHNPEYLPGAGNSISFVHPRTSP